MRMQINLNPFKRNPYFFDSRSARVNEKHRGMSAAMVAFPESGGPRGCELMQLRDLLPLEKIPV